MQLRRVSFHTRSMGFSSGLYGGQVLDPEPCGMGVSPRPVDLGVMVRGVVGEDDHLTLGLPARSPQPLEEGPERVSVELVGLHTKHKLAVPEANRSEVPHALPRRVMKQGRVCVLGWHPHPAARSVLLEVDFVTRPQVHCFIGDEHPQFF